MMRQLAPDVHAMPVRRRPFGSPAQVLAVLLRVGDNYHNAQIMLSRDEAARLAADLIALLEEPAHD